jgi:hypothetical protein
MPQRQGARSGGDRRDVRNFVQNETSPVWNHPAAVDVGQEIRDILHANGYDDADLKGAHISSMHYGVVDFSQAHD